MQTKRERLTIRVGYINEPLINSSIRDQHYYIALGSGLGVVGYKPNSIKSCIT